MFTLTSKMCFGAMGGCQKQICEAHEPKRTISGRLNRAITFAIRADLIGCSMVPTGSSDSLRGMDCKIQHRQVRSWLLALLVVSIVDMLFVFWGVRLTSELASPEIKP